MKRWQPYLWLVGAAVLPGIAVYLFMTRCWNPPVRYAVQAPAQRQVAPSPQIVHRSDAPAGVGQGDATQPGAPPARPDASSLARRQPAGREDRRQAATMRPGDRRSTGTAPAPGGSGRTPRTPGERPAGRQMPEGMRATFTLLRLWNGLGHLDAQSATPLTASQAKAILAIMAPLRQAQTLTPAQATQAHEKIMAVLTAAQREALANLRPMRRGGGGGPEGGPRPGMPPASGQRPEGERPGMPPRGMPAGNPFNDASDTPMSERVQAVFAQLEAAAGQ